MAKLDFRPSLDDLKELAERFYDRTEVHKTGQVCAHSAPHPSSSVNLVAGREVAYLQGKRLISNS